MKRVLALVLFSFAAIWAAALFDVRQAPKPSAALPAAVPVPVAVDSEPVTAKPPAQPAESTLASIGKAARELLPKSKPVPVKDMTAARRKREHDSKATGEIGEGPLSPEFAEFERRYASEVREGDWAPSVEARVRELLKGQTWGAEAGAVHCQQTTCRIIIETAVDSRDTFQRLLAVPGLPEATGLSPSTPYSLRNGQLSVYFTGHTPNAAL